MSISEEDYFDDGDYDADEVESVEGGDAVEVFISSDDESQDDRSESESGSSSEEDFYSSEEDIEGDDITKIPKEKRDKMTYEEKSRYYIKKVYNNHMALMKRDHNVPVHKKLSIVPDEERITSDTITIYEASELISHRAKQIEEGCKVYTPLSQQVATSSSIEKALEEFKMRVSPLLIMRQVSNKLYEVWDPKLMKFPAELNITI